MRGLQDTTIIDLTQGVSGPFATRLLAQMGARVIKVERPGEGELIRAWDETVNGLSSGHAWVNPGKESLSLDLRNDEGQEVLLRLLEDADVLVENYVPGKLESWGLAPERLRSVNADLIVCRISGFGQEGEYADRAALDLIIQGEAGLIDTNGSPEEPAKISLSVADISGSMYATISILLALMGRSEPSNEPIDIDIALFDCIMTWTGYFPYMHWYRDREPGRVGLDHHTMFPYGSYVAADGLRLIVAAGAGSYSQWSRFCEALEQPQLLDDPRYATNEKRLEHKEELQEILVAAFARHERAAWLERFHAAGIPSGAMNSFREAMEHQRFKDRELVRKPTSSVGVTRTLDFPPQISGFEAVNEKGPPAVGEDTDGVLRGIGMAASEIERLRQKGVV